MNAILQSIPWFPRLCMLLAVICLLVLGLIWAWEQASFGIKKRLDPWIRFVVQIGRDVSAIRAILAEYRRRQKFVIPPPLDHDGTHEVDDNDLETQVPLRRD